MTNSNIGADGIAVAELLMEEYKLHRQDAFQQISAYNQQTTFIQAFGLVLFTSAGLILRPDTAVLLPKIPAEAILTALVILAALLFYFISSVMLSSYRLLILRRRMAAIEGKLNELLAERLFEYESRLAPIFHERSIVAGYLVAPQAWSGIWRLVLFFGGVYLLMLISGMLLPWLHAVLFSAHVLFFSVIMVIEYLRLFRDEGASVIDIAYNSNVRIEPNWWHLFQNYALNYIAITFLFIVFLGDTPQVAQSMISTVDQWIGTANSAGSNVILGFIAIYSALCAIALPTPSEAPLLFLGSIDGASVFLSAALGKSIGTVCLSLLVVAFVKAKGGRFEVPLSNFERTRMGTLLSGKYGAVAYLFCQSIPFFPMRSSTMFYAFLSRDRLNYLLWIFACGGLGAIFRMAILLQFIRLGLFVLPFNAFSP